MGEKPGKKFRHWGCNSAQTVQRSERKVGRTVIQRRWIPGEWVFILPIHKENDSENYAPFYYVINVSNVFYSKQLRRHEWSVQRYY